MRIAVVFALFLVVQPVSAQFSKGYKSIPVLDTIPSEIHSRMKARLKTDEAAIVEPRAKAYSYMKSLYKGRFDFIVQAFNEDRFVVDSELNQYLNEILNTIQKGNPELPQDVFVYVYRSSVPNALCFGEGTIAISLSLLSRLENEDQVAYVLCHELAHHYRKHPDMKVKDLTRLNFDKELSKQVKEIKSSEYGQYTKLKELAKGLELSLNHHSRDHEFEADSLGLQLFQKTKYHLLAPVRTMEILDSVDRSQYLNQLDFKKSFNFKEYAYKPSWNEYTKSDTWFAKKTEDNDSTKTHPSCQKRAVALTRQLKRASKWPVSPAPEDKVYDFIRTTSEFEMVESEYHFKEYGKAMFRAIMMLDRFPDNAYLHGMIAKCLFKLHESQKNHELGKVLELPDPRFEENYDRFLTFIHRLRLIELENLAYYYVTTKKEEYFSDEDFLYAVWLCSKLPVSKLDPFSVKEDYQAQFPGGKYSKQMR